jgi:hypothetical protein
MSNLRAAAVFAILGIFGLLSRCKKNLARRLQAGFLEKILRKKLAFLPSCGKM